jgi:hypothetical protein
MARQNIRRSTTVDSLYRDRTPDGTSLTSQVQTSDKENDNPGMDRSKPTERPNAPNRPSLVNPINSQRANKRQRLDREDTPNTRVEGLLSQYPRQEDTGSQRYYNPEQNEDLRRELRIAMRHNIRDIQGKFNMTAAYIY